MSDVAANARVGWGILSTGGIATTVTRDLSLLTEEARLVAVASRRQERAAAFAREQGVERAYGSLEALLADDEVDVVYVASPHTDHHPAAMRCLAAGKAVLVEKPLTTDPERSAELVAEADRRGLFLMEAMWTRTHPLIRHAAQLVRSGELGKVRHVVAEFGFRFDGPADHQLLDPSLGGGAILDAGVYPVHAVQLLLGEPESVLGSGVPAVTGVDGHAAALLTFPATAERAAATAAVLCSVQVELANRLVVYGTRGRILVDEFFLRPPEIAVHREGHAEPEVLTTQWPGGGYTFQLQEVMRCLRAGEQQSPLVPWADTLAVARTLHRWQTSVTESYADGGGAR